MATGTLSEASANAPSPTRSRKAETHHRKWAGERAREARAIKEKGRGGREGRRGQGGPRTCEGKKKVARSLGVSGSSGDEEGVEGRVLV